MIEDISPRDDAIAIKHDHCEDPQCIDCAAEYVIGLIHAMAEKQRHEPFAMCILGMATVLAAINQAPMHGVNISVTVEDTDDEQPLH